MSCLQASDAELRQVQRELTDELQASGPRSIGARLAYTREDWLEEAAFMRGLFLRSARVSTLRQYVDEAGRARPAALADGRRSEVGVVAAARDVQRRSRQAGAVHGGRGAVGVGEDGEDGEMAWNASIGGRASVLEEYVAEAEGSVRAFGLAEWDATLLSVLSELRARVGVLVAVIRAQASITEQLRCLLSGDAEEGNTGPSGRLPEFVMLLAPQQDEAQDVGRAEEHADNASALSAATRLADEDKRGGERGPQLVELQEVQLSAEAKARV